MKAYTDYPFVSFGDEPCKNEKTKNVNAIRNKILKKGFKKKL